MRFTGESYENLPTDYYSNGMCMCVGGLAVNCVLETLQPNENFLRMLRTVFIMHIFSEKKKLFSCMPLELCIRGFFWKFSIVFSNL